MQNLMILKMPFPLFIINSNRNNKPKKLPWHKQTTEDIILGEKINIKKEYICISKIKIIQ